MFTVFSVDPKYFEKNTIPNFFLECTPIVFLASLFQELTTSYQSISYDDII